MTTVAPDEVSGPPAFLDYGQLRERGIDSFSDHAMDRYIDYINRAVLERNQGTEDSKTDKVLSRAGKER